MLITLIFLFVETTLARESYSAGFQACINEVLSCLDAHDDAELRATLSGFAADMLERRLASENFMHHHFSSENLETPRNISTPLCTATPTARHPVFTSTRGMETCAPETIYTETPAPSGNLNSPISVYPRGNLHRPVPLRHVEERTLFPFSHPLNMSSPYGLHYRMFPLQTSPLPPSLH